MQKLKKMPVECVKSKDVGGRLGHSSHTARQSDCIQGPGDIERVAQRMRLHVLEMRLEVMIDLGCRSHDVYYMYQYMSPKLRARRDNDQTYDCGVDGGPEAWGCCRGRQSMGIQ